MPNGTRKLTLWYRQAEDFYSLLLQNCSQSLARAEAEMLLCRLHRRHRSSSLAHSHLLPVEKLARDLHSFPAPSTGERERMLLYSTHSDSCSVERLRGLNPKALD